MRMLQERQPGAACKRLCRRRPFGFAMINGEEPDCLLFIYIIHKKGINTNR